MPTANRTRIALVGISLATVVAVYLGWRLFWFLTDDAFIAFRYISNGHLGYGYVWNAPPFRPVEGYTSFLWVVLLDLVWRVSGVEPPAAANYVSLLFTYLTLLLGGLLVWRMKLGEQLAKYRLLFLCLVLLGVITNRTFLAWSSSGLETAMFNFFLTLWIYCCLSVSSNRRRWVFSLTLTTALLCLTRPDGLLFAVVTFALLASEIWTTFQGAETPGNAATSHLPPAVSSPGAAAKLALWAMPLLIVPAHILWRYRVYGAWLPNTYYAKTVAGRIWPQSGLRYFLSFVLEYSLWVWLLLLLVVVASRVFRLRTLKDIWLVSGSKVAVCLAVVTHFLYYTIVIGGDHFEYRVYSQLVLLIFVTFLWQLNALKLKVKTAAVLFAFFIVLSWPTQWIHWSATQHLTTIEQTMSLRTSVARVAQKTFPATPRFVLFYFRAFDDLQSWLIGHFVCIRHQQHKVITNYQLDNLPTRAEGLAMNATGYPVIEADAAGVVAWVLPRVNIIDAFGLNDYVVARNADIAVLTLIAHERQPPYGYVECFAPNVSLKEKQALVTERALPLTREKIIECEQHYAALVTSGVKPTPLPVRNMIDDPRFFARRQYLDVLNREPDPDGLDNWTGVLKRCPEDSPCFTANRVKAVTNFWAAPETQLSAFFVYRLYLAAYGRVPRFAEFTNDRRQLTDHRHNDWSEASEVASGQRAFLDEWMQRDVFRAAYPESMTPEQFVDRVFANAGLQSLSAERNGHVEELKANGARSEVLREVVELAEFKRREHDRGLVLMQFFFQLRRDIDDNDSRYQPGLAKLKGKEPVDYSRLICLFLTSDEYQRRFGTVITRSNADCQ